MQPRRLTIDDECEPKEHTVRTHTRSPATTTPLRAVCQPASPRRRSAIRVLATVAVLPAVVIACGDDDAAGGLSKPEYVEQANAICSASNEIIDAAFSEFFEVTLPGLDSPAEFVEAWDAVFDDVVTPEATEQLDDLRALAAPEDDAALLADLYDDMDQALAEYNATLDNAVAGEEAAIESIAEGSAEEVFHDVNARARDYGLTVCGEEDEDE